MREGKVVVHPADASFPTSSIARPSGRCAAGWWMALRPLADIMASVER